jgi:hypothetical protein
LTAVVTAAAGLICSVALLALAVLIAPAVAGDSGSGGVLRSLPAAVVGAGALLACGEFAWTLLHGPQRTVTVDTDQADQVDALTSA